MNFQKKILSSKIARRVLVMFIGCSLIPIIMLSVISYSRLSDYLEEQNKTRLQMETKAYGLSVYTRILQLESEMKFIAADVNRNLKSAADYDSSYPTNKLEEGLKAVVILTGPDMPAPIPIFHRIDNPPKPDEAELQHMLNGKSALVIRNQTGSPVRVFMLMLIEPENAGSDLLVGEIDSDYLWGFDHMDTIPSKTRMLLFDQNKEILLNCWSAPAAYIKKLRSEILNSDAYQFEWEYQRKPIITSSWPIFLRYHFLIRDITVVLDQSKEDLFAPIDQFFKFFWLFIILTLLVVVFFSIGLIRRSFEPLEKLTEGTMRLADGDFSHHVTITSRDEFENLAAAFNTMSRQLGIQFKNLNTIAETGLIAAKTLDTEQIIKFVVELMERQMDFSRGMIMLSEKNPLRIRYAYGFGYHQSQIEHLQQSVFYIDGSETREYFTLVAGHQKPLMINDLSEIESIFSKAALEYAKKMGVRALVCAPIVYKHEFLGLITAENPRSKRAVTQSDLNHLIGMAAHLAGSIFNSITFQALMQKEKALQLSHEKLECRVKERTAALSDLNRDLKTEIVERQRIEEELKRAMEASESANRAKSDFLANMSHELRTPLNHIIGFTELVLDNKFGELNQVQTEFLSDVDDSSKHLLSLINNILDLSKVEAGKLELTPSEINLGLLLDRCLLMFKEKVLKHSIQLSMETSGIPETINADERKLKQIVYNLLSNAVKFTPDGGKVTLTAQSCRFNGEEHSIDGSHERCGVKISVSDTGIGIHQDDLDRIFNPFDQVESSFSRRFEGTGLGLSLSLKLTELHGGKIWVESEGQGKGSTFSFIIPA